MLSGPKPQLSLGAAGSTSTSLRPLRLPNFTSPGAVANSVSSPPRPTFSPGWKRVPRWRTMIAPGPTIVPSYTLTPRRCAAESRPLRVEPPPLVFDIELPLLPAGGDAGDLDGVVVLAVAPALPRPALVLVLEAGDLGPGLLANDASGHGGAGQLGRRGEHRAAIDQEDGDERDVLTGRDAEAFDREALSLGDPFLLPAGLDDCIHRGATLPVRAVTRPDGPRQLGSIVGEQRLVEHEAAAFAHGAEAGEGLQQALADALPGHLDEAELGDVEHLGPRLVPGEGIPEDAD